MQSDLRNFGSFTFFAQDPDNIPEPDEPNSSIDLPKALAEAEHWLDTGLPKFNEMTETVLALLHATYRDIQRLGAEFDMYENGSTPVIHYNLYDEWFASVRGVKTHAVNMKGIQQHGSKYRVQKRINGELRRWTYDTLANAIKKRDAIFSKVAAG